MKSAKPVDEHVGARLRMRRKMVGLSQAALGERVGVTFQQVQKYESGTNRIGAGRLQQLAKALDVPVQFFFDHHLATPTSMDKTTLVQINDFVKSTDGVRLMRAFQQLKTQRTRYAVRDLVIGIVEAQ